MPHYDLFQNFIKLSFKIKIMNPSEQTIKLVSFSSYFHRWNKFDITELLLGPANVIQSSLD